MASDVRRYVWACDHCGHEVTARSAWRTNRRLRAATPAGAWRWLTGTSRDAEWSMLIAADGTERQVAFAAAVARILAGAAA